MSASLSNDKDAAQPNYTLADFKAAQNDYEKAILAGPQASDEFKTQVEQKALKIATYLMNQPLQTEGRDKELALLLREKVNKGFQKLLTAYEGSQDPVAKRTHAMKALAVASLELQTLGMKK
jgi:hypothetical protein